MMSGFHDPPEVPMSPRILHVGLGPLGRRIQSDLAVRGPGRTVAAVDVDPELAGKPLAELAPGAPADVRVLASLDEVDDWESIDAAILTTSSDLRKCAPTLTALAERGVSTVSTCEELLWPTLRHPQLARELDVVARTNGASLLGTGVNPGYLMDALPVFLSAAALEVRSVRIERVQDATPRRVPFQRKIGAGLDEQQFAARKADGSLRHVGLGESLHFVAGCLGWEVERWEETLEPVLATRRLECALGTIEPGVAAGVRQVARGWVGGRELLTLEFVAAIGQADPHDRVQLESDPPLDLVLQGGVHGDKATSAMTLNCVGPLLDAPVGLVTMAQIRMPRCSGER
jgi:4-hydroxy-tetrahydrodipicolinate reductase